MSHLLGGIGLMLGEIGAQIAVLWSYFTIAEDCKLFLQMAATYLYPLRMDENPTTLSR
jgi:hypothetical protein